MKVLKFGGTSVGTVASLRNVKAIVEGLSEPAVVVVSALGGLTDKLISTAKAAAAGEADIPEAMANIRERHYEIVSALVPVTDQQEVIDAINPLFDELNGLFTGVSLINELPERTLDRIVSFGERISSLVMAAIINGAVHKNSLDFMKTERWMDRNIAQRTLTEQLIKETFGPRLESHCVTGGFISRDCNTGAITNLGRGGSDYTAALIAAALDADSLEIWTDVDGFMTADPRVIPSAHVIPKMSFVESMELCSFGAKVIYPPTIYPVFHKNIPIKILNTHNPSAPGTLITDNSGDLPECVRGVSAVKNTAMLSLQGKVVENVAEINTRTYNAMARAGISVLLVTQPSNGDTFSISVPAADAENAAKVLENEFAPELGNGELHDIASRLELSVLAVVREGIRNITGLGTRLVNTLRISSGISVLGVSEGASDATVALIVNDSDAAEALRIVHDAVVADN